MFDMNMCTIGFMHMYTHINIHIYMWGLSWGQLKALTAECWSPAQKFEYWLQFKFGHLGSRLHSRTVHLKLSDTNTASSSLMAAPSILHNVLYDYRYICKCSPIGTTRGVPFGSNAGSPILSL